MAEEDESSPFYGREYSEFEFTHRIYNYLIHPQWDDIGSPTLFIKILYVDYDEGFAIIEMMGEWNDALHNDIMTLKRDVIEPIMAFGVNKFILIGENVLNFHADGDDYYQEWNEEVEEGWIVLINFREHVLEEFRKAGLDQYLVSGERFNEMSWYALTPLQFYQLVDHWLVKRLH